MFKKIILLAVSLEPKAIGESFVLVVLFAIFVFGLYGTYKSCRIASNGVVADAICIRVETVESGSGDDSTKSHFCWVRFFDQQGTPREVRFHNFFKIVEKDDKLSVLFEAGCPDNVSRNNLFFLWTGPLLLTLTGLIGLYYFRCGAERRCS